MKTLNIAKTTNSPRGLKAQSALEKATAQKILDKINFENATIIIEIHNKLFGCRMPMSRLCENLAVSGQRVKFLCPLGKNQVNDLIISGDLEMLGFSEELEKYHENKRYKISNDGQAIEYFLKQKYHAKFHHTAKMTKGNGEFRNTEVKFFSFDKTSGTPSATCESLKAINK